MYDNGEGLALIRTNNQKKSELDVSRTMNYQKQGIPQVKNKTDGQPEF